MTLIYKYSLLIITLLTSASFVSGQTTIAIQDFDGATPTMTYAGGNAATGNGSFPNTPKFVSTSNGREVNNSTTDIVFATTSTLLYSSVFFEVRLASFAETSGNGADGGDYAIISISIDGGTTWSRELRINGNNNAKWGFSGSNAGTGTATVAYDGDNTPTVFSPAGGGYRTADGYTFLSVTGLPSNSNLRVKMEFLNNSGNEIWVIDDAVLKGTLSCIPTHSISSFNPNTGPELTQVRIIGTGFTTATTAEINSIAAAVNYISSTELLVEIPLGASDATIDLIESGCALSTGSNFTVIDETGTCAPLFSDIVITEIYDNNGGSLGYIEVHNNTGATVDLSTYTIKRWDALVGGANTHTYSFPAINILHGQTLFGRTSNDLNATGVTPDFDFGGTTNGFNADDRLELYDGATLIDDWHEADVGVIGYTYKRNTTITGPNTNYTTAEWTFTSTESTADLGTYAYPSGTPPTISVQPEDRTSCSIEMNVTATPASGGTLTYQWLYNDGSAAGWSNVTAGAFPSTTVTGATTASLSITGTPTQVAAYDGYQFYCLVTEDGTCNKAARAAQFDARESSDPYLLSAMINACVPNTGGSCDNEGENEFVLLQSGGADLVVNPTNIVLKYGASSPPTNTFTDSFVADATATTNLNNVNTTNGCGTTLFIDAVTTGTIPANSKIMLLDPNICVDAYDFSNLCSQGPIYLLFSTDATWTTTGNFVNTSATLRYYELSVTDINGKTTTTEFNYLPNSLSGADGDYAEFSYCGGAAHTYSNDGCAPLKNILPVEFLNFTASKQKDKVRLEWTTASEINSDYFEVLKSTDGENFYVIETLKAAGNSSVNIDYLSYDYSPNQGANYYQIHEVDFDNSITNTPVRVVQFGKEASVLVSSSNSEMSISYTNLSENSMIEIFTIEGKPIYTDNIKLTSGNILYEAKKNQQYLIRIISNTTVKTIKYIH